MIDTAIDPEVYRSATGDLVGVVLLAILFFAMFLGYRRRENWMREGLDAGGKRPPETRQPQQREAGVRKAGEETRKAA